MAGEGNRALVRNLDLGVRDRNSRTGKGRDQSQGVEKPAGPCGTDLCFLHGDTFGFSCCPLARGPLCLFIGKQLYMDRETGEWGSGKA